MNTVFTSVPITTMAMAEGTASRKMINQAATGR